MGKDPKTKLHSYLFKIIDEDFEEDVVGTGHAPTEGAVINCYSKRNLNVSKNLFLMFMYYKKQYEYSIQQQISWCIKYQLLFPKYKEDVEKYLTLI